MAQRKRNKRRRRARGSLSPFFRVLSVLLTAVVIVAALTLFFKVETVSVEGNERYSTDEIVAACGVISGDNLVLLDKYQIARTLYTSLPYITNVRINRAFPDKLEITVEETYAVLSIESGNSWWLLSATGKVLEQVDEEQAKTHLFLTGMTALSPSPGSQLQLSEDSPLSTERLLELVAGLQSRDMLAKTQQISADNPKILTLSYDGRFLAELYYDADFRFKLDCLKAAVNELEPNETGIIRMTMENENEVRLIPFSTP